MSQLTFYVSFVTYCVSPVTCHLSQQPQSRTLPMLTPPQYSQTCTNIRNTSVPPAGLIFQVKFVDKLKLMDIFLLLFWTYQIQLVRGLD